MSDFEGLNDKDLINSYTGQMSSTASHRSFIDIQPNISVRPEMNRSDYYRFRTGEAVPEENKHVIKMCLDAYDKVGIIKNVIDLMGDFASQGITLVHEDPKIQKFCRSWWKAIHGTERSERFLNTLYRSGNVIIIRRYAKLSKKMREYMTKGTDTVEITSLETQKNLIPFKYDILNPMQVSVKGGAVGVFFGKPIYEFNISKLLSSSLKEDKNAELLNSLPQSIRTALKNNEQKIELDPKDTMVYHYKKDDWQLWANPLIYAILDDIVMFEKMKLADMAALDGAISNIRLWRLGDLEHKIVPSRAAIDKLRDILASNVGGGTMDLVWGPELDFKESNTQIYKFLGDEKYTPVLNSIYAGLGIPPTLTGLAGQSGGYTNNFVSLKTLIDRLQYGRTLLEDFWNKEIRLLQKALGLKSPPKLRFDHMLLADEAAEKNLLMNLADRGYISLETLRERLGEDNDLEKSRTKKEYKDQQAERVPPRSDPFHNGNVESELIKIALQKGLVGIQDVTDIDPKHAPPIPDFKPSAPNGRPPFKKDAAPRKQKTVVPKTKPTMAQALLWADSAYRKISELMEPCILDHFGKANLRCLTKEERRVFNDTIATILSNHSPYSEVDESSIANANHSVDPTFKQALQKFTSDFVTKNGVSPSVDDVKQLAILSYAHVFSE